MQDTDTDAEEQLVQWTTRRVVDELAGVGIGEDPEECLVAVVDRLVEQLGAEQTANTLRGLADELPLGYEIDSDDGDPDIYRTTEVTAWKETAAAIAVRDEFAALLSAADDGNEGEAGAHMGDQQGDIDGNSDD